MTERKRLEAQAQTQRDDGLSKIPMAICDRFDELPAGFLDILAQLENNVTPKRQRSEQNEILFNKCEIEQKRRDLTVY